MIRRVALTVLVLFVAGCTTVSGLPVSGPSVPSPSSVFPSASVPPSPGLAATEEQLRHADPCLLADWTVLEAFGDVESVGLQYEFTRCGVSVISPSGSRHWVGLTFDLAIPAMLQPEIRNGVTVYIGEDLVRNLCERGVVVAERAVVYINVSGVEVDLCAMADRVLDSVLPKLVSGDLPRAAVSENSLANADACALLRPEEVFRLRGIDRTQVRPGFGGHFCGWGEQGISDPNAYVELSPARSVTDDTGGGGRRTEVGGLPAVVHAEDGDYGPRRGTPICEVGVEYRELDRPDSFAAIEKITVQVRADADEKYRCSLAVNLAEAVVGRLS